MPGQYNDHQSTGVNGSTDTTLLLNCSSSPYVVAQGVRDCPIGDSAPLFATPNTVSCQKRGPDLVSTEGVADADVAGHEHSMHAPFTQSAE
jgi:hypothetical protein